MSRADYTLWSNAWLWGKANDFPGIVRGYWDCEKMTAGIVEPAVLIA